MLKHSSFCIVVVVFFLLSDTAKARDFLLQRISQDFQICRRGVVVESSLDVVTEPRFHLPRPEVKDSDQMTSEPSGVVKGNVCDTRPPD